jgi:sec-independent protein translocase protein TatA
MPFHIGPPELTILLTIVMIIFGVGRLPEIGGALGKAIREFRQTQSGESDIKRPFRARLWDEAEGLNVPRFRWPVEGKKEDSHAR